MSESASRATAFPRRHPSHVRGGARLHVRGGMPAAARTRTVRERQLHRSRARRDADERSASPDLSSPTMSLSSLPPPITVIEQSVKGRTAATRRAALRHGRARRVREPIGSKPGGTEVAPRLRRGGFDASGAPPGGVSYLRVICEALRGSTRRVFPEEPSANSRAYRGGLRMRSRHVAYRYRSGATFRSGSNCERGDGPRGALGVSRLADRPAVFRHFQHVFHAHSCCRER